MPAQHAVSFQSRQIGVHIVQQRKSHVSSLRAFGCKPQSIDCWCMQSTMSLTETTVACRQPGAYPIAQQSTIHPKVLAAFLNPSSTCFSTSTPGFREKPAGPRRRRRTAVSEGRDGNLRQRLSHQGVRRFCAHGTGVVLRLLRRTRSIVYCTISRRCCCMHPF